MEEMGPELGDFSIEPNPSFLARDAEVDLGFVPKAVQSEYQG